MLLVSTIISFNIFAQNVGINDDNSSPNTSAMLDVQSTTKGMLIPRMTITQRTAISNPATGLLVFDTNNNSFWFFDETAWTELHGADHLGNHLATQNINLNGNHLSGDGGNEGIYVDIDGKVGIGMTSPTSTLHVNGSLTSTEGVNFLDGGSVFKDISTFNQYGSTFSVYTPTSDGKEIRLGFSEGGDVKAQIQAARDVGSANHGYLAFRTRNVNMLERMRITSSGNIGIGTTSPTEKLQVTGTIHSTLGGIKFPDNTIQTTAVNGIADNLGNHTATQNIILDGNYLSGDGGNEGVFVNTEGKVGIGMASPSDKLNVLGAIKAGYGVQNGGSIANAESHSGYMIIVSSNYGSGNNVRSAIYHVLTNHEGDAVSFQSEIHDHNNQTATFSVSNGNLIVNGLPGGNNQIAVFRN